MIIALDTVFYLLNFHLPLYFLLTISFRSHDHIPSSRDEFPNESPNQTGTPE